MEYILLELSFDFYHMIVDSSLITNNLRNLELII